MRSTSWCRRPRRRRRSARRWSARSAGRSAAATSSTAAASMRSAPRSSESSRARSTRSCGERSAEALIEIGFDGYAVGGLAVGEGQEAMLGCLDFAVDMLPGRQAALSDGRRQARRYRRGGRARDRHVRLRASDALGAHRPGVHRRRPAQPAQRALRRGHASRSSPAARAPPARSSSAPMSITSSNRARSSARC